MRNKDIIKNNALYIIYFGILTRILLFIKDILTASKIGVNHKMDSYLLAFSTIMLLTKIIGDGLIVAIIPLLQEIEGKYGKERTIEYTNNLVNFTALLSFILIIIGYLAAPIIIKIFGPGFKGVELETTITLFRIGLPIIIVSWIRAIGGGFLQSNHAFKAGAKGGVSNALIYIIYLLFFSERFGLKGLMVAGILGIISQIYIIVKAMENKGYKYKWNLDLKDKYLPRIIKYLLPIIMGIGVNELNNSVDNAIASTLSAGSIAELNYANDIISLFLGIFIASIVTVIFPVLSESHKKDDINNLKEGINHGIYTLAMITLPVSIILMFMAEPIVKIVFERGAFDATASFFTSQALSYYALGIPAMALMPLITRIYYAIDNMKTPLLISILVLIINIAVDLTLAPFMGARGLALGTSASVIIGAIMGLIDLNTKIGFTKIEEIAGTLLRLAVATTIMIGGILITYGTAATTLKSIFLYNLATVGISTLVGIGLYYLVHELLN